MITDGDGGSTMMTPEEAKAIMIKKKNKLVPQLRFPPGYHFVPTDFELLDVYLRGKIEGRKPPLNIFMDVKLLEFEPDKLVAERKAYGEGTYFFFTVREEWPTNKDNQPRRKLREVRASWKATGSVAQIYRPGTNKKVVVGTKRMLTYSSGRRNHDKYSMYEYVLEDFKKMDQWVLCTIQEKQNWNANRDKDENTGSGKDEKAGGDKHKKRKSGAETCLKPKTTKRKNKKTATSQPQETQEQQEITSAISSNPPPLLGHEQVDHHQASHKEGVMAFEETSPAIQVVAPHHEYLDGGDQPYYDDTTMQEETMAWDGPPPPLMTHQQQCYQALSMEEQQFDILGAQYISEPQFSDMAQLFHPEYPMSQYQEEQQPLLPYHTYEYELLQQHVQHCLGTPGFHRDIVETLQDAPQFLQESGKPPSTSPDNVLGGPDPGLPSENAYPYSDSDAGMMNGVASTVATCYGSTADHEFNPFAFQGHIFDENLAGNGGGSHVATELPDHGSNQALHTCQYGVQWWCGEQQGVDVGSCF